MFRIEVGKIALEEVVFGPVMNVFDDVIGDTPLSIPLRTSLQGPSA